MANKIFQSKKYSGMRTSVLAVASCLALSGVALNVHAAGLGRLVVLSGLGQPLRAEIEVTATREELADMKARLAPPEAFKQAGIDYATTLLSINFKLDKRPNGQAVIKLSSERPINDPFVDMLMELNWASGRLVREYTFLLDPPEYVAKSSAPVAPVVVGAVPDVKVAPRTGVSTIDSEIRARAMARVGGGQTAQPPAEKVPPSGEGREVKRGETLHKIASETRLDGVSLDQMLVGLFRANPDAFEGGNMNRLKAGRILSIPEKEAVASLSAAEARKIVVAQSSDWGAYRSRLAGVAARSSGQEDSSKQEATGKITAKVEDAKESAVPKDQLKVSKADTTTQPGKAVSGKVADEDLIAKEKALKEASERNAALEKNIADLEKLLELRNKNLAELQKQSAAAPGTVAPAQQPVESEKPPQPQAGAPAGVTPAAPAPVVEPAKAESPAVTPAPEKPVSAEAPPAQPVAEKPVQKPKVPVPPPAPVPEPGFFDELLENPMALAGGGGVLALLAAYFFVRRRRSAGEDVEQDLSSTLAAPSTTSLTANSVFRSTGGQSVDTSSQTPAQTDFSQAGPGSIDTDEVDPVAEADVYMAYGRDAQAEEILLEARQKDPKRHAIVLKLLEIYSGRKDVKQFEALATELYGETAGAGPDWDKAAAMGRVLDPNNPIFRGAFSPSMLGDGADVDMPREASPEQVNEVPITSPAGMLSFPDDSVQTAEVAVKEEESAELASLDFDLGEESKPDILSVREDVSSTGSNPSGAVDFDLGATPVSSFKLPEMASSDGQKSVPLKDAALRVEAPDLDFDIGAPITPVVEPSNRPEKLESSDLDFDLGDDVFRPAVGGSAGQTPVVEQAHVSAPDKSVDEVEFDVSLTESTFLGRIEPDQSAFNLSSIDLDLESPELEMPKSVSAEQQPSGSSKDDGVGEDFGESAQVATAVNPDFAIEQMETQLIPTGFSSAPSDIPSSEPFGSDQMDTMVSPDFSAQQAETIVSPSLESADDLLPDLDVSASEEVATKLDLAKAYEEMGDLEGARELLQEVLKEGDATQRESARSLLDKIGA